MTEYSEEPAHSDTDGTRTWLKDGIVHVEYTTRQNLASIVRSQERCLSILKENNLAIAPVILIYTGKARDGIDISITDLGKLINMNGVMKHISRMWSVGASEQHKRIGAFFNKFFVKGRFHFADSLEEAERQAAKFLAADSGILEPDTL